ncbi:MAG: CCA tRNA nucleotidyltransferase [Dehalococcoidia bacterium]|nr:MAG: CCA tRNA nucleotidyltransferase [Dehalococcoidia bacterium]
MEADSLRIDPQTRGVLAEVASFLDAQSLEAYVVGGFLRDALLRRESNDVDLAVAADPLSVGRELADVLAGHFVRLHEEHKAARIVLPVGEAVRSLDLLPLRLEIEADLAQRDLTINAMAVPIEELVGEREPSIIDPCGGRRDLDERTVRMVRPEVLRADALRLLRAVRLCAELDFALEPETAAVIAEYAPLLFQTAPERQRDELMRILATPRAAAGLRLADELGLLEPLLPEVVATKGEEQPKEHQWDVFDHSLETVVALDALLGSEEPADKRWARLWRELWGEMEEFPAVREHLEEEVSQGHSRTAHLKLAALLHDIAKPETRTIEDGGRMRFFGHAQAGAVRAAAVARRLRFSGAEVRQVEAMVKEHLRPLQIAHDGPPSRRALYRYFRDAGEAGIDVLFLSLADHLATVGPRLDWDDWRAHLGVVGYILAWRFQEEKAVPPRLITGHDLMDALGLTPGPLVGRLLEAVQEAQAAGEVTTREQALALARQELERTGVEL